MRALGHVARPLGLLPILAAGAWTSLASRVPEHAGSRGALGQVTIPWDFAGWDSFDREPAHAVARLFCHALLQLPVTLQYVVLVNALLAATIVLMLAGLVRRSFAPDAAGQALALAGIGLLVCTPAFGADWLFVERAGTFLAVLLPVWGLGLLLGEGSFWWRGTLGLLFAGMAPFCHANGQLAFVVLLPALVDAARRAGSARTAAWVIALLLVGNAAAALSMSTAGPLALDGTGLLARMTDAPVSTLRKLLEVTGAAWLDPIPATAWDDEVLGGLSWLVPIVMWRFGDRTDPARRTASPWWGCVWFGLLLPVWLLHRHGIAAPAVLRELGFGAFLLPIGCVGLVAVRCGSAVLPVAAGAVVVLGAQDWYRGIEALRLACARAEAVTTAVLLPDAFVGERPASMLPVRRVAEWQALKARGLVPVESERKTAAELVEQAAPAPVGHLTGGDATTVRGQVRSTLFDDTVHCVLIVASHGTDEPAVIGRAAPSFEGQGRDAPWVVSLERPLVEGSIVRAVGYRPRSRTFVALGPGFALRGGALVAAP